MLQGKSGSALKPLLLIMAVLIISDCYTFHHNEILKIDRQVALNAQYPTEIIKIQFTNLDGSTNIFEHVVTTDMQQKIGKIAFSKQKNAKEHDCFSYKTQEFLNEDGQKQIIYIVDLKSPTLRGEESTIYIKTQFINRFRNLPKQIALEDDQKLQYEDYKHFYSPYSVKEQTATYKFSRLISYSEDGEKSGIAGATFKTSSPTQKFDRKTHVIHGVNNNPQMIFTEVEKIIEISHWGNIAITEFYKLKNTGPQLKGQFSRIKFNPQGNDARNAFVGTQTSLPHEIWGLYYRDEVGNVSTSSAFRDNYKKEVRFAIVPRFSLVGGWKSNFEIGYNLDTSKGFLMSDGNEFETRKISAMYAFKDILAEKYSIKVILPEGSSNAKIQIGSEAIDHALLEKDLSFSYLDFLGRPAYTVNEMNRLQNGKIIEVQYKVTGSFGIWRKPIIVFGMLLSLILVAVILNRIKLQAFEDTKAKSQ